MASFLNRTTLEYFPKGNTPDFPPADWIKNPNLSAVQGVPKKYWKIVGDDVLEMNQSEKDAVDTALLPAAVQEYLLGIEAAMDNKITQGPGFEWPPSSGQFFSLSLQAQIRWVGLSTAKNDITYPLEAPTTDHQSFYEIQNAQEAGNMFLTAVDTVNAYLQAASAAKKAVLAATTLQEAAAAYDAYVNGSTQGGGGGD